MVAYVSVVLGYMFDCCTHVLVVFVIVTCSKKRAFGGFHREREKDAYKNKEIRFPHEKINNQTEKPRCTCSLYPQCSQQAEFKPPAPRP
mmetsp:Transcript_21521/g.27822  ORF Transcript_21521/g.27822 Transcript_21521/m.27822 type:complete len:89 (-) Transcript_21521:249-515(-)